MFISKSNNSVPRCPQCHADMFYRDSRRRILKLAGGEKQWLVVRRFRCRFCNKLHTEMLDCIVPYKHYRADIIMGVVNREITSDILKYEDYPCFATMQYWINSAQEFDRK